MKRDLDGLSRARDPFQRIPRRKSFSRKKKKPRFSYLIMRKMMGYFEKKTPLWATITSVTECEMIT